MIYAYAVLPIIYHCLPNNQSFNRRTIQRSCIFYQHYAHFIYKFDLVNIANLAKGLCFMYATFMQIGDDQNILLPALFI